VVDSSIYEKLLDKVSTLGQVKVVFKQIKAFHHRPTIKSFQLIASRLSPALPIEHVAFHC